MYVKQTTFPMLWFNAAKADGLSHQAGRLYAIMKAGFIKNMGRFRVQEYQFAIAGA